jgi:hypothetical protein
MAGPAVATPRAGSVPRWLDRAFGALMAAAGIAIVAEVALGEFERRYALDPPPPVAEVHVREVVLDERPVALTVTAGRTKVPFTTTYDAVRSDLTVWRQMHFDDWDTVPAPLRAEGLDAMLARFDDVLASPAVWDRMGPLEWDLVPQPVRAMAFRHMAEYWSGYYGVGAEYGIPRRTMADVLAALVMSESWFDHRAVNVNRWGNRDLGVAQAADATRQRLAVLHEQGAVDLQLSDEDYFDPWKGTRFVAVWMGLLLEEVGGDLDTAIAAYHRGVSAAHDSRGQDDRHAVKRRLRRFIRNEDAPPAWDDLWRRDAILVAQQRPWMPPAAEALGGEASRPTTVEARPPALPRPPEPASR